MPNNEQATIPGASHELGLMEKPEVFNKLVLEFYPNIHRCDNKIVRQLYFFCRIINPLINPFVSLYVSEYM